ncbi:MAG: Putative diheme cytochrome c-553 [Rhodanobacteraceae bacterium]|nr:MAG: Putative diheme cytochrome c-553 [Rhodanobacteraceae bacterium]
MNTKLLIAGVLVLASAGAAFAAVQVYAPTRSDQTWSNIRDGRYLARAGDCEACHTAEGGKPYAGGRPVPTPFGIIYSTNITPDPDTGIGAWSEDEFYRAMHEGIDKKGERLYPAFPYPWFTHMTRGDVDAIKAYLDTIKPVRQVNRAPELGWPFSMRSVLAVWDKLYLDAKQFEPDPKESAEWNRGAYLVEGPGHCAACHTSKNMLGGPTGGKMQGGMAEHVFAPNLGAGERDGLGSWTREDIVEYLATGSNRYATAAGPMAEVVQASTQYLKQRDLEAMATYLKSLEGPKPETPNEPGKDVMQEGAALYVDNCAGCHMNDGAGLANAFPPLRASSAVQAAQPELLIAVILQGARSPVTESKPSGLMMPAFNSKLDDAEVAALTTYIRNAWGNRGGEVSSGDVAKLRSTLASAPQ